MSEHTKGRLKAVNDDLMLEKGRYRMVHGVTSCGSSKGMLDERNVRVANSRRLAACWNAMDGVSPPIIDCIVENGGVLLLLEKASSTERQLAAARALLSEVVKADEEAIAELTAIGLPPSDGMFALTDRIRNWLDVCSTLGGS